MVDVLLQNGELCSSGLFLWIDIDYIINSAPDDVCDQYVRPNDGGAKCEVCLHAVIQHQRLT